LNKDGKRFENEYIDDKKHGYGIEVHKNGNKFEGEYIDNK
jgi:hypothetical protein